MAWTASPRSPPDLSLPRSCAHAPCIVLRTLSESRGCLPRAFCAFSQTKVAKLIRSHWSTYSPDSLAYPQADGNSMTREWHLARGWHQRNRHRGDSNPCGQSPMDFESISLTARTQCHAPKQERWLKRLVEVVMRAHPRISSFDNATACKPLTTSTLRRGPYALRQLKPRRADQQVRQGPSTQMSFGGLSIAREAQLRQRSRRYPAGLYEE
jgi:hypothetical protein